MSGDRTSNSIKNSISGFSNKFVNIMMPFIVRTIIIYYLGIEYAGLNNLFSSVLQVLNLAELGLSSAIVYCLYKPMADDDIETICAILKYMRKLYYIIGCIVLALGLILIPFLSFLVNGKTPNALNIYIIYITYLLYTVIGYFFYSYKTTLLNAGQKIGIISNINTLVIFIQSILQIIIIILLKNYYFYILMLPIFALINNIWVSYAVKKIYPQITCRNSLCKDMKKDISTRMKGLFVTRICTTTRNAFDSIFISSFLGLTVVGIYGNYYYIMSAVVSVLSVITTAITASVGNSLVTESIEKNYNDMIKFNFIFNWIVGFASCCMLILYQPFMRIWIGDNGIFDFEIVILICVYFYFLNIGSIRAVYHDAAGLWWEARYRAIFEAILNLVLNVLLTKNFGVFGTILGTLISLLVVNYLYGTQIVFKYYFKGFTSREYFIENIKYMIVTIIIDTIIYLITTLINVDGVLSILIYFIIAAILFNLGYFLVFSKTKICKESMSFFQRFTKHNCNKH